MSFIIFAEKCLFTDVLVFNKMTFHVCYEFLKTKSYKMKNYKIDFIEEFKGSDGKNMNPYIFHSYLNLLYYENYDINYSLDTLLDLYLLSYFFETSILSSKLTSKILLNIDGVVLSPYQTKVLLKMKIHKSDKQNIVLNTKWEMEHLRLYPKYAHLILKTLIKTEGEKRKQNSVELNTKKKTNFYILLIVLLIVIFLYFK